MPRPERGAAHVSRNKAAPTSIQVRANVVSVSMRHISSACRSGFTPDGSQMSGIKPDLQMRINSGTPLRLREIQSHAQKKRERTEVAPARVDNVTSLVG